MFILTLTYILMTNHKIIMSWYGPHKQFLNICFPESQVPAQKKKNINQSNIWAYCVWRKCFLERYPGEPLEIVGHLKHWSPETGLLKCKISFLQK